MLNRGIQNESRSRIGVDFVSPDRKATLLDGGDAECIRSELAAGHHGAACGLLLNRAIELLPIAAAMVETTLPP
jgi:hypothetical protein